MLRICAYVLLNLITIFKTRWLSLSSLSNHGPIIVLRNWNMGRACSQPPVQWVCRTCKMATLNLALCGHHISTFKEVFWLTMPPLPSNDEFTNQEPQNGTSSASLDVSILSFTESNSSYHSATNPTTLPIEDYPRHSRYYLDDGNVTFLVCRSSLCFWHCVDSTLLFVRWTVSFLKSIAIFSNVTRMFSDVCSTAPSLKLMGAQTRNLSSSPT